MQTASAAYDESCFTAAAVTAMVEAMGVPQFVERTRTWVGITVDGRTPSSPSPTAGRGGVPVFGTLVTPGSGRWRGREAHPVTRTAVAAST